MIPERPYLNRRPHGYHCRHWCAAHWTVLDGTGQMYQYPITVATTPVEFKWDDEPDPIGPAPKFTIVHCGPGAQYPAVWRGHDHD